MDRKLDMDEIVNERGETRAQHIDRIDKTAEKLAEVLAETTASYTEVDLLFEKAKEKLCVTCLPVHRV